MLVVFIILATVTIFTGNNLVEWLGVFAVLFTFGHASVSNSLAEEQHRKFQMTGQVEVECYRWSTRYYVLKESFWLFYFILHQSYAALVGVIVFLLYPLWRKWYRKHYPYNRHTITETTV